MRGLAIFATALAVYLLLPQRVLHGVDGNAYTVWIESGSYDIYARHAAYLRVCGLVYAALEPFGAGGFLALRVTSALGSALGLVFLGRAFALLLPAHLRSPLPLVLAVFATPSCFYFATQAEIAGVFAAGAGAAWWAFARFVDRPGVGRAAVLGLACAAAGALHALGHLLDPALLAAALVLRRLPRTGLLIRLATVVLTHAAAAVLLSLLLTRGATGQANDAVAMAEDFWRTFAPLTAPAVLYREWLLPFVPWSVGAALALTSRGARPPALAALLMVLLYLGPNVLLLGFHGTHERGAYYVGLAPIAVLATASYVSARGFRWALLASAIATVLMVAPGWRHPLPPDFGAGIEQLDREHKIALVVANQAEMDGARTAVRGLMCIDLREVISVYVQQPPPLPPFGAFFDVWYANLAGGGMTTVFTPSAVRFFVETGDAALRAFWRDHVPQRYELREVERGGFRGTMIVPR